MSWENSRALSPLKRDLLEAFFALEQRFFVSGGTALGVFYLGHRRSNDIDLFTTADVEWLEVESTLRMVADKVEADLEFITRSPDFMRVRYTRKGNEAELVDLVHERVTQLDPQKAHFGPVVVDTMHEIGVNKIALLISRCEQKDIIDLYFLSKAGFDIVAHLAEAARKEGGLDPATMSFLLSNVRIGDIPEYMVAEVTPDELNAFVARLRDELAATGFPLSNDTV